MNYHEHMQRHLERIERERAAKAATEADRLTALRVAYEDGQRLLRGVIKPEMDAVAAAVQSAGRDCLVKIGLTSLATFEVEFEIEIRIAATPAALIYCADPRRRVFTVTFHKGPDAPIHHGTLRYDEITPDLIRENCGAFLQAAFPA